MKILSFFAVIILFAACKGEPKVVGESALTLDNIDFKFDAAKFYADPALYNGSKDLTFQKDTIKDSDDWGPEKPMGIQYRQASYYKNTILAKFEGQSFYGLNMATTLDNKLMVVAAVIEKIGKDDSDDFIASMTKKYGPYEKTKSSFMSSDYDIYKWKLKDRHIQYSPVYNDESNVLKLESDEKGTVKEGKKDPHYKGYVYIVNNQLNKNIFGSMRSGDFIFLD